ncbi:aa3-type cytochrome oxidase subunit II [Flaviflexus massiliensis]|uniref:aa3-type cytochrome oxidase subunit II n=1 Tax=Flaviflexus massiliensis TaxID=1522309 RepID=UPI000A496A04|nr:cytochrome c oxidase subunit II [Flaviflexus massiliensis]
MRETQQRRRGIARFGALLGVVALASACSSDHSPSEPGKGIDVGFLPSTREMTDRTGQLIDFWNGAWFAAVAVGALVWVLVLWCVIAYRKRKNDNELPVQLRYHVPLEILYTIVPIIMVGVLFVFSTRATAEMNDVSAEPDVEIEVYGKQWSWDFNYTTDDVHYSGDRISFNDGEVGAEEKLPTLYLPVDETVEFTIKSRDVIHSFWIPAFLYKIDMVPGRVNTFQVTPQEEGVYSGKCAELCGEYHAEMVFNVAVVDRDTYDAEMEKLREAGNTGTRGDEYNRQYVLEGADNGDH